MQLNHKFKAPILKKKIYGKKNDAGKNHSGKITCFHRGGGHKKKFREVLFNRSNSSEGIVINIEYDPNRNSYIGAIYDYKNYKYFYILLPKNLKIGDIVKSGSLSENRLGHSVQVSSIPIGSCLHNISLKENSKGILIRSSGTFSVLIEKLSKYVRIKLRSGEHRLVPNNCFATLGVVSNESHFLKKIKKAGRSRWLNRRPVVRGVAMNPIDHPHGGGEGKSSGGSIKRTPWGKPTLGRKTSTSNTPLIVTKRIKKK